MICLGREHSLHARFERQSQSVRARQKRKRRKKTKKRTSKDILLQNAFKFLPVNNNLAIKVVVVGFASIPVTRTV